MKKKHTLMALLIMLMVIMAGSAVPAVETQAASGSNITNVLKAPTAKQGSWVYAAKGKRYRFTASGNYAKARWLKIEKKIYYFTSDGYVTTGLKNYKGRLYYLNKSGQLQKGWQTINGKKYYFWKSKSKGSLAGSAATGKVMIAKKYYYFDANHVRKTGWVKINGNYYYFKPANGQMAVNTTVAGYVVDATGKRIRKATTTHKGSVDYWVGDSRTVGLGNAVGISSKCIAKVGEGYNWYISTAEAQLKAKLKKKPTATVVINLGVNDITEYNKYISRYRKLIKEYPNAKIYFMSVNPVDNRVYKGWVTNKMIKTFNNKLKASFPGRYINTYSNVKFYTVDGLHYTVSTYRKIYNYVLSKVA